MDAEGDGENIHEFCIRGLHCSDCVRTVEAGLEGKEGVDRADVNLASGRVCVTYDPVSISPEAIEREVRRMGYAVDRGRDEDDHPVLWSSEFVAALLSGVLLFLGLVAEHAWPHWHVLAVAGIQVQAYHLVYLASMVFGGAFILRRAVTSLMALTFTADGLMIIAAIGATAIGAMAEGTAVLFLYSVAELLEDWAAERNRGSLRALVELAPQRVSVLRDGGEVDIPVEEVEVGDVAVVRPGDRMPVDGVVAHGSTLVNEATITGEAAPVPKVVGSSVYAGTLNVDGAIEVRVDQRAHNTALNRIISMVEEAEERRAPVERFIDRFAKWYTPAVLVGAVLVATIPTLALGADVDTWVYRALMLLVIACPCALAISVPVAVVSAVSTSARRGILFKGGAYLEQLSEVDVVAFDKTGTLTTGEPQLADVRPSEGWTRGNVLAIAAGVEAGSEHHLARAVMRGAEHEGVGALPTRGFKATPGKGIRAERTDSGVEVSLGNPGWAEEHGLAVDDGMVEAMAAGGRTVVVVAQGDEVVGLLAFSDTPRPGARGSVAALQGVRAMLLSGDSRAAAKVIADRVGIPEIYAPLLPQEKAEVIGLLRADGHRVAMVGDGVNDAPSLAEADVGIAMGAMGSDVAMETADVVLLRDDVGLVPTARNLSVRAMGVIRQNIALAISIKLAIAALVFVGLATLWMAVAIGDMGASLIVILNALRLGVPSGGEHRHATLGGGGPPAVAEASA